MEICCPTLPRAHMKQKSSRRAELSPLTEVCHLDGYLALFWVQGMRVSLSSELELAWVYLVNVVLIPARNLYKPPKDSCFFRILFPPSGAQTYVSEVLPL